MADLDSILNFVVPILIFIIGLAMMYKIFKNPIDMLVRWVRNTFIDTGESSGSAFEPVETYITYR